MNKSWIMALVLGLLASIFYVDHYYGLSVFIMTVICVGTMYHYKREANITIGRRFYLISGYMLVLSPVFAVTTVVTIRFWSGVILLSLLLSLAITENTFLWPSWVKSSLGGFFGALTRGNRFFTQGKTGNKTHRKIILQIGLGLLIALPILFVAAALLASADEVMNQVLSDIMDEIKMDNFGVWVRRGLMLIFTTTTAFGYSHWFKREQSPKEIIVGKEVEIIPPAVSGTVLLLLNGLYLIFAYIQIRFLFLGGHANIEGGYHYAEYARSGFFELVTLSILNTIGILVIKRFTKVHLVNNISLTVTALCTFVMMASSTYKMRLYEQAYGYTQLRLYVYFILAFMVVFIALIALGIWRRSYRVVEWSIVIGLCYFLVLAYVNVDEIIVNNNVARYEKTGDIDLNHLLWEVSEDGTPSVMEFLKANPSLIYDMTYYENVEDYMLHYRSESGFLRDGFNEVPIETRWFFEYNARHSQAVKAVEDNASILQGQ